MPTLDAGDRSATPDGVSDGFQAFRRAAEAAEAAGRPDEAKTLRDAIRGAFEGLRKKLEGESSFWRALAAADGRAARQRIRADASGADGTSGQISAESCALAPTELGS